MALFASIHFPLAREDAPLPENGQIAGTLQSTSLLRGKTEHHENCRLTKDASIHFPLAREDMSVSSPELGRNRASIHFPLAREDCIFIGLFHQSFCFNPLPSCEGRPKNPLPGKIILHASIHFPLAREDGISATHNANGSMLQPTSLLRGKT